MENLTFRVLQASFLLELFAGALLFMIPLKKRRHFVARSVLLLAPCLFVVMVIPHMSVLYIVSAVMVYVMIYLVTEVSRKKALYLAMCSWALQHLTYAVGSIWTCIRGILFRIPSNALVEPTFSVSYWVVHVLVYGVILVFILRRREREAEMDITSSQTLWFSGVVMLVVYVLSNLVQGNRANENYKLLLVCYLYSSLCCVFIIILEENIYRRFVLKNEITVIQNLWLERREQYAMAKENIDVINRKCHELKKQITEMGQLEMSGELRENLDKLKDSIRIYDAVMKTGNEILDVTLTEKSLYCHAQQISLICVAKGELLNFIEMSDIYFLFANGLDYAVESVKMSDDAQKRQIAVLVSEKSGLLLIQIEFYQGVHGDENRRDPELEEKIGAGMDAAAEVEARGEMALKSMRYIVKKYKGVMTVHDEELLTMLRISIPIPGEE